MGEDDRGRARSTRERARQSIRQVEKEEIDPTPFFQPVRKGTAGNRRSPTLKATHVMGASSPSRPSCRTRPFFTNSATKSEGDQTDGEQLSRNLREAEAVALICCEALELPGAEFCRGYIQDWLSGSEIPERSCQRIFAAANKILEAGTAS